MKLQALPVAMVLSAISVFSGSCLLLHKPKPLLLPAVPPVGAVIDDKRLDELSGIVASRRQHDVLYTHNDSGDSSRFFAVGTNGIVIAVFSYKGNPFLKLGVKDVEDITMGPEPDSSTDYIYLGDIGDNHANRKFITVYRVKEPAVGVVVAPPLASAPVPEFAGHTLDAASLYLRYPDGARDAETLMADPIDRRLYIVSKREDSVIVYSTPLDFKSGDTVTLTRHTRLFFPGHGTDKWITAGDVSPGGDQVLLKSYGGVFYWQRRYLVGADSSKRAEPLWQTLRRQPVIEPYSPEKQGEAIGFSRDEKGFYTISEGRYPLLYHYPLVKP